MRSHFAQSLVAAGRAAALGVALAASAAPLTALAAQETAVESTQAQRPTVEGVKYRAEKNILVLTGTGFDDTAVVRFNGVEVQGERKFKSDKGKLRIVLPTGAVPVKADGQNTVEVIQNGVSSGSHSF
jgi:hypothetical protein